MRASAIIRIIIWSFVAIVLTGVLIAGLKGDFSFGGFHLAGSFSYADSEHYLIGGNQIDMNEVSEIEINWVSGNVEITPYEGREIIFREQANRSLAEEDMMRFYLRGRKLIIQFCAPKTGFHIFSNTPSKSLEVQVPYELASALSEFKITSVSAPVSVQGVSGAEMKIVSVSGGIDVSALSCRELELEAVSGRIHGENIQATELDIETVSGGIDIFGVFQEVDGNSVSGSMVLRSSVCPREVDLNTVSGSARLEIPENDGFTAKYNTTSGQLYSSFPTIGEKKRLIYKNGGADFSFSTVSGNITIERI